MNFRSAVVAGLSGLLMVQISLAEPMDSLAKNLAKGVSSLKNKKVAVLAFPYHDGKVSSGSSVVSERITTQLVGKKGIRVVERRLIQQLLSEKKLSETGIISQENLKDIGTLLDADAIVTGTLIDLNNGKTEINARLISADSGEVLSAGQESIERTWKDSPVMPKKPTPEVKTEKSPASSPSTKVEAEQPLPPPLKKGGKPGMRLSNESFPADRRVYHGGNMAGRPKKKPLYPGYEKNSDEDQGSYEDGYADATHDAQMNKQKNNSAKGNTYNSQSQGQGLQHPTQIGVVRPDGYNYGYGSSNYPPPTYVPPPPRKSSP